MKVSIPNLQGKELFDYLRANKANIIKQKTAFPIKSECNDFNTTVSASILQKSHNTTKGDNPTNVIELEPGKCAVTVIGNTALWCDSQLDVLLPDCWKKSIKDRGVQGKDMIYHLRDHEQETCGIVGYPTNIYSKEFSFTNLGLLGFGSTQCLMMDSNVQEELDDKIYKLYSDGKIKQHSIGMLYINLVLCINDPNDAEHYPNWQKYYNMVINKDFVDNYDYFWAVLEIKLLEISAVLFGSNEITPTISVEQKNNGAVIDTSKNEPTNVTHVNVAEELRKIKSIIPLT